MKPLRIALVTSEFPPVWGGIGSYNYYLSGALAQRGHAVAIVTPKQARYDVSAPAVKVVDIPCSALRLMRLRDFGRKVPNAVNHDFDIVHLHYPILAMKGDDFTRLRIPVISTFHGTWREESLALRAERWPHLTWQDALVKYGWRVFSRYENIALTRSHAITTVSDYCMDTLRRFYRPPLGETHCVPCGVDVDVFRPDTDAQQAIRRDYGIEESSVLLICTGRLVSRKGHGVLLRAFHDLVANVPNKVHLLIVGKGLLKPALEEESRELGVGSSVHFVADVSSEVLSRMYAASDVFVLPSLFEGFGLVYLEAMACGTPVIGTTAGAIPLVIRDGIDGLLCRPNDAQDLFEKLRFLVERPALRAKMAANGRQRVIQRYTWRHVAELFETVYRGILDA